MIRTVVLVSFVAGAATTVATGNPIAGVLVGFGCGAIVTAIWALWR